MIRTVVATEAVEDLMEVTVCQVNLELEPVEQCVSFGLVQTRSFPYNAR